MTRLRKVLVFVFACFYCAAWALGVGVVAAVNVMVAWEWLT